MGNVDLNARIPNNVGLADDKRLLKALEHWLPLYMEWWNDMGPAGFQTKDIYLRTAISVEAGGWANFDYVQMPDYRWGIFLTPPGEDRTIGFGDHVGKPVWQEIPGEYRGNLRRIIVTQADTEPASVEQQRFLGSTAPSLYDMRNLFQVNVEEGRHLWAMVYLLFRFFGKDGRDEAEELLSRRSGDEDKPRILNAFNQPCDHWLSFFSFTHFTDRDGKFQLASLAESGFEPMARTCDFMLTEEVHHLFVGETGLDRIIRRSAELTMETDGDPKKVGGIPLDMIQRSINYWFSYSLDLFGGEISSNAANFFGEGLKGRFKEKNRYEDHVMKEGVKIVPNVRDNRIHDEEVPYRNAMNEVLRDEYIADCDRALRKWNRTLEKTGIENRLTLPSRRFKRHQGIYADNDFNLEGELISKEEMEANVTEWLLNDEDNHYLTSIMKQVVEPGKMANWIAPPARGINSQPIDFEYVRL
ncbi:MAG TPA: benzoyl-CoA 2,3-epoxidase subunit BoxB [Planctomycetes bacterium]|nr:benzoyl-CoA 2,3-epoxidase subunit BoxB [Planctomycetota bacterium]